MEFVDGWSLRAWLAASPRSWREVVRVFVAAGRGLAAVHEAQLVHRDFKPDNVLISSSGEVKVSDFGLAILATQARPASPREGSPAPTALETELTLPGSLVGT